MFGFPGCVERGGRSPCHRGCRRCVVPAPVCDVRARLWARARRALHSKIANRRTGGDEVHSVLSVDALDTAQPIDFTTVALCGDACSGKRCLLIRPNLVPAQASNPSNTLVACESEPLEGVATVVHTTPLCTCSSDLTTTTCTVVSSKTEISTHKTGCLGPMPFRTTTLVGLVGLVVAAATDATVDPNHARALLVRSRIPPESPAAQNRGPPCAGLASHCTPAAACRSVWDVRNELIGRRPRPLRRWIGAGGSSPPPMWPVDLRGVRRPLWCACSDGGCSPPG